jgi:hypothetical protein
MTGIEITTRIHWWQAITDLMLIADMTQEEIGQAVGANRSWVANLRNDYPPREPLFHRGALLLGLWQERVGSAYSLPFSRVEVQDIER